MNVHMTGTIVSFQFSPAIAGIRKVKELKRLGGGVYGYAGQAIPQIDADSAIVAMKATTAKSAIAEKGRFWMETSLTWKLCSQCGL